MVWFKFNLNASASIVSGSSLLLIIVVQSNFINLLQEAQNMFSRRRVSAVKTLAAWNRVSFEGHISTVAVFSQRYRWVLKLTLAPSLPLSPFYWKVFDRKGQSFHAYFHYEIVKIHNPHCWIKSTVVVGDANS